MPLLVLRLVEVPAYKKYLPLPAVWAVRLRAAAASASAPLRGADEILICRYDKPRRRAAGKPGGSRSNPNRGDPSPPDYNRTGIDRREVGAPAPIRPAMTN